MNKIHMQSSCDTQRQRGFTLIEVMIALVVVALLAAIAYPSYLQQVVKSNRSTAQSHLMDIAQRQQQYLLDNRSYAADVATLSLTTPTSVSGLYTISIAVVAGPPPTFTATATPIAGKAQASDGTLTINSAGTKTPTDKW